MGFIEGSRRSWIRRPWIRIGVLALAVIPFPCDLAASTLPVRRYTTADGLPTNSVTALLFDTRGFLWVGTDDGLARFDGERFELFDDRSGLPPGPVSAIVEGPEGTLYVSTDLGVARLTDGTGEGGDRFEPILAPTKEAAATHGLAVGPDSVMTAATDGGLLRLARGPGPPAWELLPMQPPLPPVTFPGCNFIHVDPGGNVWSHCGTALLRVSPQGRADSWDLEDRLMKPLGLTWLTSMLEDRRGRAWISGSEFLWRLVDDPQPGRDPVARDYSECPGGKQRMFDLIRRRDGTIWAATSEGPAVIRDDLPDDACPIEFLYQGTAPLSRQSRALAEDEAGNLWAAEFSHGLVRIPAQGFTFFGREEGVPAVVDTITQRPGGEVVALAGGELFVMQAERFQKLNARLPAGVNVGWGARQRILFDRGGGFWIGTRHGLLRWSALGEVRELERRLPDRHYTMRDGLTDRAVLRLFEDSRGDLWIGMDEGLGRPICRWTRKDDAIKCFGQQDGVPPVRVRAMVEDPSGQVWMGFRDGTLLRHREGRFDRIEGMPGFAADEINALLADPAGRLWVAAPRRGLYRIEGLQDESPRFTLLGRDEGLSSLDLRCLVRDDSGRVYVGTGRGIDRLDPAGGRIRHYTALEGLQDTSLASAMRAEDGTLWFGTADGIARLVPRADPASIPPRVYVMGLRIAGEPRSVPVRGAVDLGDLSLASSQSNVEVEFTGIGHGTGERLVFQTWLEGAEAGWSEPLARRSISYARLAPGRYRFHVRGINADGVASINAAGLTFQVAAPVWRRWWFLSLAAIGLGAIAIAFHRQRTARLVEIERVRMRIASDLHDEVGAGLSEIALMGEVWARAGSDGDGTAGTIAATSRRLVDSMSDIVWAINPEKDRVFSLSQRMRQHATAALRNAGVTLRFQSIEEMHDRALDGGARRELLLAFQEMVHNAVKHAACSTVDVRMEVAGSSLLLQFEDDGRGFRMGEAEEGTGLSSLRRRAAQLGGVCEIRSSPGSGTRIALRVPLDRRLRGHGAGAP